MEKRKANIMFAKNGQGRRTTRMSLPVTWVDVIGATDNDREVNIYQIGNEIIITKEELIMTEEKALELAIKEVTNEIKNSFINESDGTYFIYELSEKILKILSVSEEEEEENIETYKDTLAEEILKYLKKNYGCVSKISSNGDATVYYYDNCFDFETVEELEKYFKIEEE